MKIILASSSPRRKYLLGVLLNNFGLKFEAIPPNIDEFLQKKSYNIGSMVKHIAKNKAFNVSKKNNGIIVGADTVVVLNGRIIRKPESKSEAKKILKSLSGKMHKVYTGIAVLNSFNNELYQDYEMTKVKFRVLVDKEIDFYIKSGATMDKAGAYGIQDDFGSTFVEKIYGDYFNVVGLPLLKTYLGLKKFLNF